MTNKERALAVLNYGSYDRLPVVHFGFWIDTLRKWSQEGHITAQEANGWADGTPIDQSIGAKLGFDFNWYNCFIMNLGLEPLFETKILEELPDGMCKVLDSNGVTVLQKKDTASIPILSADIIREKLVRTFSSISLILLSLKRVSSFRVLYAG